MMKNGVIKLLSGNTMKSFVILVVLAAIICFTAGCGPGQPFEIEEHFACLRQAQSQFAAVK